MIDEETFLAITSDINCWILRNFSGLFSLTTLMMLGTCLFLMFSKWGNIRIGGPEAKPILTRWRWFAITLCTTVAVGLLFWGPAEPLFHLQTPAKALGITPLGKDAGEFAMSMMFLHWSFTPYAIYAIPSLAFAIGFYNRSKSFSLSATLFPFFPKSSPKSLGNIIDGICLFTLVAGMASSLSTSMLSLSGGIHRLFGFPQGSLLLAMIALSLVAAFTISASTGLLKGIRILSTINVYIFIAFWFLLLVLMIDLELIYLNIKSLGVYITTFFERNFLTFTHPEDSWAKDWTVFYWANWMAWAPISALFLGRISYGYTIREILLFIWIIPSCFAILWISIYGGVAVNLQLLGNLDLVQVLNESGAEAIIYRIFDYLSLPMIVPIIFVLTLFLSFVTAADSNTEAMGGISSSGISPESPSPPVRIKIIWGVCVGITAYIMVNGAGIDGIKMLSNLGGFPALFLLLVINVGLIYEILRGK